MGDRHLPEKGVGNYDLTAFKKMQLGQRELVAFEQAARFSRLVRCLITEPLRVNLVTRQLDDDYFTEDEMRHAMELRDVFCSSEICRQVLSMSQRPHFVSRAGWQLEHKGMRFKLDAWTRWPIWMHRAKWGADIKVTSAKTERQFAQMCQEYDYDRGRAWAMDVTGADRDLLIGLSKTTGQAFTITSSAGGDFHTEGRRKYLELAYEMHVFNLQNQ